MGIAAADATCGCCGQDVPVPLSVRRIDVDRLPDGRHRWTVPAFYGVIVHECPVPDVVAEAEAILRAAGHQ